MLATLPDAVARKVAEDIRDFGHGYVRFDAEGRAEFVPAHVVLLPMTAHQSPRMPDGSSP